MEIREMEMEERKEVREKKWGETTQCYHVITLR